MKNDLTTAVVLGNSEKMISDKDILLAMVDLEEQFRKGNSTYVSQIIQLYQAGHLNQAYLLFYYAFLLSTSQSSTLWQPIKIPEMRIFEKIKERLTESLEAAFGDAAEKENAEVVERLLESNKF